MSAYSSNVADAVRILEHPGGVLERLAGCFRKKYCTTGQTMFNLCKRYMKVGKQTTPSKHRLCPLGYSQMT